MAAKRITGTSINWAALAERVPEAQKANYLAFKARSDNYLRRVLANPETPPKIDWAAYKKTINVAGLVDTFQKSYEALQIPYPADPLKAEIDAQEKEVKSSIDKFKSESNQRIVVLEAEKKKLDETIPYSQMTYEEFFLAHPELALDPVKKPTFWPHEPEDQPGYKSSEQPAEKH